MAIFGRKKQKEYNELLEKYKALKAKGDALTSEELAELSEIEKNLEDFENTDFAAKEKRAGLALKIGIGIIGVLALLVAGTAIAWGPALYAIGFIGSVGIAGGLATAIGGWFARRNYRAFRKLQELYVQAKEGKTSKGRTLSTEKQTAASHKLAKSKEKLVKKGYISQRVADKYNVADSKVEEAAKKGRPSKAGREAYSAMAKSNRERILTDINESRNEFLREDIVNYDVNDAVKSKVEVKMHKFDKDGNVEYNADGKPLFETVASYDCNSDIDLIGTRFCINEGLDNDTVFPVIIKVASGEGKPVIINLKDKEDWAKHCKEFNDKALPYLTERYHEPTETHEHTEEHSEEHTR